ncbi:MAG TPA: hypothetical protein VF131_24790 [Blastocatellia bacterium]|nr:hypothetical protein [Blastocatellia bacterium]
MKKPLITFLTTCLFLAVGSQLAAQTTQQAPPGPPPVLFIFREEVKASRGGAHEKLEAGYVRALQKANWPTHSLAISSISGPHDAWFMTGYESYAAMEKDHMAMEKNAELMSEFERLDAADAEFRTNQRGIIGTYRPNLSHNVGAANIPQMRYFQINTVRVRPGHEEEWIEARRILVDALKKANIPTPSIVYGITVGMPGGTFLVFTPRKSLAEMDPNPDRMRAVQEALGEEKIKKRQKLISDSVMSTEMSLYAFSPRMSYVSKEWIAAAPDFWAPKEMVAMKSSPKTKKSSATATVKKQP